jgi:hypothetical protein
VMAKHGESLLGRHCRCLPTASACLQVHPPTAVSHAAAGFITHVERATRQPDLVISRGTQLSIYTVRWVLLLGLRNTPC